MAECKRCPGIAKWTRGPYAGLCVLCAAGLRDRQAAISARGAKAREDARVLGPLARKLIEPADRLDLARSRLKHAEDAHRRKIAPLKLAVAVAERDFAVAAGRMGLVVKREG